MKILVLVASLKLGGTERVANFLVAGLQRRGYNVVLLTKASPTTDFYTLSSGVRRRCVDSSGSIKGQGGWFSQIRGLLDRQGFYHRVFRSEHPDCVIAFSDHLSVRTLSAACGQAFPVVVSERNNPRAKPMPRFLRLLRRLLYPHAAALVTPSRALLSYFPYVKDDRKRVIPNPVIAYASPDKSWQSAPEQAAPDRTLTKGRSYVFGMGRLTEQKGFDILIDAFAAIAERFPTTDLVILGEGPLRPELEAHVQQRGLAQRVILPGAVTYPHEWLVYADVFVLASRFEGFPNALLEAMGLGCPCIATDCPTGPAEIIQNNENGVLIPPSDSTALSTALSALLLDEALRARLGSSAKQIQSVYGEEAVLDAWEQLLKDVT